MIKLETGRLLLRPVQEEDFAALHACVDNVENLKYNLFGPNTEEETREFIRFVIEKFNEDPCVEYNFTVILKETGSVIGNCEISRIQNQEAMLGWMIHKNHWKKGYGTELAGALLWYCFERLKLHRVWATCDSENYGSYKVMEKNGMRREGEFIKKRNSRMGWRNELLYAILDEEWRGSHYSKSINIIRR